MNLISFVSGRHGAGKTTLAAHLASHAHGLGFRSLLVDATQDKKLTFWRDTISTLRSRELGASRWRPASHGETRTIGCSQISRPSIIDDTVSDPSAGTETASRGDQFPAGQLNRGKGLRSNGIGRPSWERTVVRMPTRTRVRTVSGAFFSVPADGPVRYDNNDSLSNLPYSCVTGRFIFHFLFERCGNQV
jgi:hypothetical protein